VSTPVAGRRRRRLRASEWFALTVGGMVIVAVLGMVLSLAALHRLSVARGQLADRLDPAAIAAEQLKGALVDQETGVRGFALAGDPSFLDPYRRGGADASAAEARLRALSGTDALVPLRSDLTTVLARARDWQTKYADPSSRDAAAARDLGNVAAGKRLFDAFRSALTRFQTGLAAERAMARQRLSDSAGTVHSWVLGTGLVVLLSVLAAGFVLRRVIVVPLQRLAAAARMVALGDFEHRVEATGAAEVVGLGEDAEAMRARIVAELAALQVAQHELQRSNSELEQFAYVASHDLQEPLRKVASFCQLLQQRYGDQLDERADQYIGFAVDGARRMQELINDLLAFSRVGRLTKAHTDVDCGALVKHAEGDLAKAIEESGARIEVGELPTVQADESLLRLVFQNLIGNAIKFREDAAPVVRLAAERDGEEWRFRCSDNGIGIDAEYAERIFIIFQRLHPRSSYEGTGIGLAMCRKIVEYHGGRMWLDTEASAGSSFCFTLPANGRIDDARES
jgi:signal transduction histidine kinase